MLFVFCMSTMTNAASVVMFASIFDLVEFIYGVDDAIINYMFLSFFIAFIPVNFPSVHALDKYGLRVGLLIGIIMTTVGLWMRCLIHYNFTWVIIGQTIIAIG